MKIRLHDEPKAIGSQSLTDWMIEDVALNGAEVTIEIAQKAVSSFLNFFEQENWKAQIADPKDEFWVWRQYVSWSIARSVRAAHAVQPDLFD